MIYMANLQKEIENFLLNEPLEDIIGIEKDDVVISLDRIAENESIIDYHGRTRRIKLRLRIYPEHGEGPWLFKKGPVVEIRHFCVCPQNHGYGTRFIAHLIAHLHDTETACLVLQAMNKRAVRFWRRMGFIYHPWENREELRMFMDIHPRYDTGFIALSQKIAEKYLSLGGHIRNITIVPVRSCYYGHYGLTRKHTHFDYYRFYRKSN